MIVRNTLNLFFCLITNWYLIVLIQRTGFSQHPTSIGKDIVLYMYCICTISLILSLWMQKDISLNKMIKGVSLMCSAMPLIVFSLLYFRGIIVTS